MVETTIRTTCPYCGVGCGVLATPEPDGSIAIKGDPDHPANLGRLCSKGSALGETLSLDDRLLHPEIHGQRVSWDAALDLVANRFLATIAEHGPDSVAFYVSGQLLTEDYYVANKLMKGFIGSANIDTNSRLCMASSVAGHRRAFGADTVPGSYADLDEADLVVLVGSNFAWCHPVLFQRLLRAREARGTRIVVVDPRSTMTAKAADLHLALQPDSDLPLFLGLLGHLNRTGLRDHAYMAAHVGDAAPALAIASEFSAERVAEDCGLKTAEIEQFYRLFGGTKKVVTVYSQGINQSVSGTDKVNAIINCHLFTGRIGKPGMGPFSITGQPNAMGGREVGGLANMLAAHMEIENAGHRALVQRFWQSPTIAQKPGLKAVDLFKAVGEGKIKALWIMATNPADSLPDADQVQAALKICPFVVVSDAVRHTDTTRFAHVLLPAAAWGEKNGTVTNSERRISRQRSFLPFPGQAKPDWWHMVEVASRMGYAGFAYSDAAAIFAEHAALSGFENERSRDFDISAYAGISAAEFDALEPFQWPHRAGEAKGETRFFANGGFYTPDGKARMVAVAPRASGKELDDVFPLWLNTGRIRDQWHTMTRTGKAPRLMGHIAEPFCEIHPDDAEEAGIAPGSIVCVKTAFGSGLFRAAISDEQHKGSLFVPMHWTDQFASRARINAATHPATDPTSGQPGLKACPAAIEPFQAAWHGFAVLAQAPAKIDAPYWALARTEGGYRLEMAGDVPIDTGQGFAMQLFGDHGEIEWVSFQDSYAGVSRHAAFSNNRLIGALFIAPKPLDIARQFLSTALMEQQEGKSRLRLLAGCGGSERADPGAIICSCFAVGINQIVAAIENGDAMSVEAVGAALKAGTNCGSCRGDISKVISAHKAKRVDERAMPPAA